MKDLNLIGMVPKPSSKASKSRKAVKKPIWWRIKWTSNHWNVSILPKL